MRTRAIEQNETKHDERYDKRSDFDDGIGIVHRILTMFHYVDERNNTEEANKKID